jgi:hypothetical protein
MSAAAIIELPADAGRQLEHKALSLHDQAKALKIVDQPTYNGAVDFLRGIKALRGEAEAHHRPVIDAAHRAHKAAVDALKRIDGPLEIAERAVKGTIAAWDQEQQRLRREEEERLRKEEEARRDAELEAKLESSEAAGASSAEVRAMISQAALAPPVVVAAPPRYERAAGVATRKTYSGQVVSLIDLIRWVAQNPQYCNLLKENPVGLNQLIHASRGVLTIPGVRVVEDSVVSVR